MKKISYKCKNCGGKLNYAGDASHLICNYCNSKYDHFVTLNDINLDNMVEKLKFSSCYCNKCGNIVYEYDVSNKMCPKCNNPLIIDEQVINGVILNELNGELIKNDFIDEVKEFKQYIPKEFFVSEFKLKYVKSKLYDGYIEIVADNGIFGRKISRKYVFFDLIVPNSPHLTYRNRLEFLYNGIDLGRAKFEKADFIDKLDISTIEFNSDKKSDLDYISNACLNDFKVRYKNASNIKVISNLDVKYNFLIPIFQSVTNYNGIDYYNTVIAYRSKNKRASNFCFNFPPVSEEVKDFYRRKYIFFNFLFKSGTVLSVVVIFVIPFIFFLAFGIMLDENLIEGIAYIVTFIVGSLSFFFWRKSLKLKKVVDVYLNNEQLDVEKFYAEVVNETNKFVPHVEWR